MYSSSKSLEGAAVEQLGTPMGDLTAERRALGRRDWLTSRGGLDFGALSPVERGLPRWAAGRRRIRAYVFLYIWNPSMSVQL